VGDGCETCRDLLNEALNLAIRSEQFEEQHRRALTLAASLDPDAWQESGQFSKHVDRHNAVYPHAKIAPASATMHLWVQDQYDKDLASWTHRARAHMTQCKT